MTHIRLILLSLISVPALAAHADVSFTYINGAAAGAPVHVEAPASSGLNGGIYVAPTVDNLRLTYSGSQADGVRWLRYSALGAAFAEEIAATGSDGTSSWIDSPQGDLGYAVEVPGGTTLYIWLTDYSRHVFNPGELTLAQEQDCGRVALDCTGSGDEIVYYSINGRRLTLSRDISLTYNTLAWDESAQEYVEGPSDVTLDYLTPVIHAEAPLCSTSFTLEGDRFLKAWGAAKGYTSVTYEPTSVSAHTAATADNTTSDNEISSSQPGALGGSAPLTVTFTAQVTDAAIFHEWQFSRYHDFDDIAMRASELVYSHTFNELGTTYVRLYCANTDASCEYYGPTYEIAIGESMLKCPNAFSPYNQDGVNDVWKVTYSSIVEYECHIFNRNGHKIISLTDPSQGWDGRYNGKFVPTGAYYYVIKARGADGKDYKLSGDINLIEYK